jgi:hypothetical protein
MEAPQKSGLAVGFVGGTGEVIIKDGASGDFLFAPLESFGDQRDFDVLSSIHSYRPQGTVAVTFRPLWNHRPRARAYDVRIVKPSTDEFGRGSSSQQTRQHSPQLWERDPFFLDPGPSFSPSPKEVERRKPSRLDDPFFLEKDSSSESDDFFQKKKKTQGGHAHVKTREHYPLKIRAGLNQGLYVLNQNALVEFLFTDGLNTCSQVIWRNDVATFCVHIDGNAPHPEAYLTIAFKTFVSKYGPPVGKCHVVSAESVKLADRIAHFLRDASQLDIKRTYECPGLAVRMSDGSIQETPTHWGCNTPEVGGTLTSPEVIDLVLNDKKNIGFVLDGDYSSSCPSCN